MIKEENHTHEPRSSHFDFVVVDGYSGLSLASATETLQNANLVSGQELYSWRVLGVDKQDVRSSTNLMQRTDGLLTEVKVAKDVVLISGEDAYNIDVSRLSSIK